MQLTNVRLLVLQSVAALSSLHQNIRLAAVRKSDSHSDKAAVESELTCFIIKRRE